MNRIQQLLHKKQRQLLSLYFTAGFPSLEDTPRILKSIEKSGVDFVEIGFPFSDPIADGPTIQHSCAQALENGMSISVLFEQLKNVRTYCSLPIILMGYLNPILQYGIESFCAQCHHIGIDGLILPDLPLDVYKKEFKPFLEVYPLSPIFLITPQTSEKRVRWIDQQSDAFIYMVSSASITGAKKSIENTQIEYFNRIRNYQLDHPQIIGFGISNQQTFDQACQYASGAIIGSAFIKMLSASKDIETDIAEFVKNIRP